MKSIFVYNPESGNGKIKKHKDYIVNSLKAKYGDVDVVETKYQGHASELARDSVNKYDYFFVCGGDGTLNEVINGMKDAQNKPIIGYLPCGTVNDVARSLGLTKNLKRGVKNLVTGVPFAHDTFRVNDKYGIYVCCAGLFTSSSYTAKRKEKKLFGKIAYFFSGARDVFVAKPVHVQFETKDEVIERNCSMVLILNSRSVAGFRLNKNARLNDGLVELVLFHSHKKKVFVSEILRCIHTFLFGLDKVKNSSKVTYRVVDKFTLRLEEGTTINLDGEKSGSGSFEFEVLKENVKLLVPPKICAELTKNQ